MSNSSLVNYTKISPNRNSPRNHTIDTITIHCVVGQCSVEALGSIFADPNKEASSNYGVGPDGRIGMYVEEKDRSWCSSSSSNDNRAVTIEVASDTSEPYAVTDKALNALVKLVADICKRNGIKQLKWKGDSSLIGQVDKQNMTVHRWFANKSCPGTYLYNKHPYIAREVNKLLGSSSSNSSTSTSTKSTLSAGSKLNLNNVDLYVSSTAKTAASKKTGTYYVWSTEVINNRIRITNSTSNVGKSGQVTGWISYSTAKSSASGTSATAQTSDFKPYKVKITADVLNIRSGAGTNHGVTGTIRDGGVYTIVDEKKGTGSTKGWGKLKSGAGWICLDYTKKI